MNGNISIGLFGYASRLENYSTCVPLVELWFLCLSVNQYFFDIQMNK